MDLLTVLLMLAGAALGLGALYLVVRAAIVSAGRQLVLEATVAVSVVSAAPTVPLSPAQDRA